MMEEEESRIIEVDLFDILEFVKMAGLKSEVEEVNDSDEITITISGFQNAGDLCYLIGKVIGTRIRNSLL